MDRAPRAAAAAASDGDVTVPPNGPVRRGAAVVLLVWVAVVASALSGPWSPSFRGEDRTGPEPTPVQATPLPPPTADPLSESLEQMDIAPWNLSWLWTGLALLVVSGVVHLAIRWLRSRRRSRREGRPDPGDIRPGDAVAAAPGVVPDLPALREGLDDADEELRRHRMPADAVIAAWVALEDAADRSGVPRDRAATPTEFTVAVLDRTGADRVATRVLLALYLRARFGSDPMTPGDVTAATAAVRVLTANLAPDREEPGAGEATPADGPDQGRDDLPPGDAEPTP